MLWTKAVDDILKATKTLFINCKAGINRSSLFAAILFLAYYTRATVEQVMEYLKQMRPCCEFVEYRKGGGIHPEERRGSQQSGRN